MLPWCSHYLFYLLLHPILFGLFIFTNLFFVSFGLVIYVSHVRRSFGNICSLWFLYLLYISIDIGVRFWVFGLSNLVFCFSSWFPVKSLEPFAIRTTSVYSQFFARLRKLFISSALVYLSMAAVVAFLLLCRLVAS